MAPSTVEGELECYSVFYDAPGDGWRPTGIQLYGHPMRAMAFGRPLEFADVQGKQGKRCRLDLDAVGQIIAVSWLCEPQGGA